MNTGSRDDALLMLMKKTGYPMDQKNGQRIFGPPPDWTGPPPKRGSEIFVGKIPRDCYEDVLVPAFEICGRIYLLRLMMDFSGSNRGYCFVMYTNPNDAHAAVQRMNNYEIQHGRFLGVCMSLDNCQLFYGNIPPEITEDEFYKKISALTEDVVEVTIRPQERYAYVEYKSHRAAAMARRKLIPGRHTINNYALTVDWAEPKTNKTDELSIFIQGIPMGVSEDQIKNVFNQNLGGNVVDHVKKMKDSALVNFSTQNAKDCAFSLWKNNAQNLFHGNAHPTKSLSNTSIDANFLNSFNQFSINSNRIVNQQLNIMQTPMLFNPQISHPMPASFQHQRTYLPNQLNHQLIYPAGYPQLRYNNLPIVESKSNVEKLDEFCNNLRVPLPRYEIYTENRVGEAGDVILYQANLKFGEGNIFGPMALSKELAKKKKVPTATLR